MRFALLIIGFFTLLMAWSLSDPAALNARQIGGLAIGAALLLTALMMYWRDGRRRRRRYTRR